MLTLNFVSFKVKLKLFLNFNLQSSFKKVSSVIQNKHKIRNNCLSQTSESNSNINNNIMVYTPSILTSV